MSKTYIQIIFPINVIANRTAYLVKGRYNHNHIWRKECNWLWSFGNALNSSSFSRGVATPINPGKTIVMQIVLASKQHKHMSINMQKQNLKSTKRGKSQGDHPNASHLGSPDKHEKKLENKLHADTTQRVVWSKLPISLSKRTNITNWTPPSFPHCTNVVHNHVNHPVDPKFRGLS